MLDISDHQKREIRKARDFVTGYAASPAAEEREGTALIHKYIDAGYHSLLIPEKHGGKGYDFFTAGLIYEELSYGCIGIMPSLLTMVHCAELLKIAADGKGENRLLEILGSGRKIFGFCLTEENAGSDIAAIQSTAVRREDSRLLNGVKTIVINCGIADYYIVVATSDPEKKRAGLDVFVVDSSLEGITCDPLHRTPGFRYSRIGAVKFDDVTVSPTCAVGDEGSGYLLVMETFDKGRPLVAACCVGAARRVFDIIVAHAKSRKQFGRNLYSFQGVSFRIADFATRIKAATLLSRECLSRIDRSEGFTMEASMSKLYASEILRDIAAFALELMGQQGYREESEIHDIFHASQLLISIDGSSNIQRMVIASQL